MKRWTPEDIEEARELYQKINRNELAAHFNVSIQAIKGLLNRHGIKSPRSGQFIKGQKPWNAGTKGLITGGVETQFKKGHKPHNTKYDGCITLRSDKTGKTYFWVRIGERNWNLLHQEIYKQHYGPIPKNYIVRFKDGNTKNVQPQNLECVSRAQHMERNRNTEKAHQSMEINKTHPAKYLSNAYVAGIISTSNPKLKKWLLTTEEGLAIVRVAKLNFQLKRQIKKYDSRNRAQAR